MLKSRKERKNFMTSKYKFSPDDRKAFAPAEKIGLVAVATPEGLPHLSLLTSLMAPAPTQLTVGEFCKGASKDFMAQTRKTGFAVVTLDKKFWRGKALWTHIKKEGPEYEIYNLLPMFRYNTYFGIHTVHYLDLKETSAGAPLPMASIVRSALFTRLAKGAAAAGGENPRVLSFFGEALFNRLDALKFLSYVGADGYPVVIPVIQCQAADNRRLAFSPGAFSTELGRLEPGMTLAVLGLTMQMESVLVRGVFNGFRRFRGVTLGTLDIAWVYNSMPPNAGQIYPPVPLSAVVNF